ncbi:MAG: hypothetical protein KGY38_02510 [Desulfobacterales bacterium]|nr:hypothetical protein [Desulfobacterales bacterium]
MSDFFKSFSTGCGALILICFFAFIVAPLILFVFKVTLWIALPVIALLIIIAAVALFGRLIIEIKDRW